MSEIYSTRERTLIFVVLLVCALVVCFIYMFLRVDYKQISIIIFIISLVYATAFIYLNLLASFDLIFTTEKGFEKLLKVISKYYKAFTWIDKILGFVIFNFLIHYLESGYYHFYYKLADFFIRKYNHIKKMTLVQIIVKLIIWVPIIITLLVFLLVYRNHF